MTSIIGFNGKRRRELLYEKEYITQSQMAIIIPKDIRTLVAEREKKKRMIIVIIFFLY